MMFEKCKKSDAADQLTEQQALKDNIKRLQAQSWEITRAIHFVKDPRKIEEMQKQREKITEQLNPLLEQQKKKQKEKEINATKQLIRENGSLMRITANGHEVKLDTENLVAHIHFFPCGHNEEVAFTRFISYEKERLWLDVIKDPNLSPLKGSLNCSQCRKEHAEMLKKGIIKTKRKGFVAWTLRFLK